MRKQLRTILARLRQRLERLYGPRLRGVILYGSQTRGEAAAESDIDVLVVLSGPVDPGHEIARTGHDISDLSLRQDVVLSCLFVSEEDYREAGSPLLRNVRREGVAV